MTGEILYKLSYTIKLEDFLETLAYQHHTVDDRFLEYVAQVLLRYKILDRPIITGDVSPLGRLALYSLISKYNAGDTQHLESKFKYHEKPYKCIESLNATEHQNKKDIAIARNQCGIMFRLNKICSTPIPEHLPNDAHDTKLCEDIFTFFDTYKKNYEKANRDNRIDIPIFAGRQTN